MSSDADTALRSVRLLATATARLAWQAIAGVRYAVSPNIDLGLKYRFFNVPNLKFGDNPDQGTRSIRAAGVRTACWRA